MKPRVRLIGDGWFPDRPTGLNRYVQSLLEALVREGVVVDAVVLGPASGVPTNVEVAAEDSMSLRRRIAAMGRGALSNIDILDAHFALYALRPAFSRRRRNLPLVVHFHGPWSEESRVSGETSEIVVRIKGGTERLVYSRAREVVVLSGAFKRLLVERYRVSPWRVTVIPPGVDLFHFVPANRLRARDDLGLPRDAWIVVSVRRLVPRMGVDVLLRAWAEAQIASGLLIIAGEGPERARLEAIGTQLGLADSVQFAGRLDRLRPSGLLPRCRRKRRSIRFSRGLRPGGT